jgi:hypothetical protein
MNRPSKEKIEEGLNNDVGVPTGRWLPAPARPPPRLAARSLLASHSVAPQSHKTLRGCVIVGVARLRLKPPLDWKLETRFLSLFGL